MLAAKFKSKFSREFRYLLGKNLFPFTALLPHIFTVNLNHNCGQGKTLYCLLSIKLKEAETRRYLR